MLHLGNSVTCVSKLRLSCKQSTVWSVFTGVPCWRWAPIDLTLLWPHYYSQLTVRRRVMLRSQCGSSPAFRSDVCNSSSFLELHSPATSAHTCVHFLQGDMEGLCFLSERLQLQNSRVGIRPFRFTTALQMRRKTRAEEGAAARPLLPPYIFPFSS